MYLKHVGQVSQACSNRPLSKSKGAHPPYGALGGSPWFLFQWVKAGWLEDRCKCVLWGSGRLRARVCQLWFPMVSVLFLEGQLADGPRSVPTCEHVGESFPPDVQRPTCGIQPEYSGAKDREGSAKTRFFAGMSSFDSSVVDGAELLHVVHTFSAATATTELGVCYSVVSGVRWRRRLKASIRWSSAVPTRLGEDGWESLGRW